MSLPQNAKTPVPFDEDEDLFRFDELYAEKEEKPGEELDLDEFLKAFEQATPAAAAVEVAETAAPEPVVQAAGAAPAVAVAAPVLAPVGGPLRLSRGAWIAILALLSVQATASVLVWAGGARARAEMARRGAELESATSDVRREFDRRAADLSELTRPIVGPRIASAGEAFARAERELALGRFAAARRELFATLAIVDRWDGESRDDVEARARFLLADSYRLEADRR